MFTVKLFGFLLIATPEPPEETDTVCVCVPLDEDVVDGISTVCA